MSERWFWRCPVCGRLHVIIEPIPRFLSCDGCGKSYEFCDVQLTPTEDE